MVKLQRISGKHLINALKKIGFNIIRIKGSHHFLQHNKDRRCTVVPVHGSDIIGPGLLNKILRDCEITKEDLARIL